LKKIPCAAPAIAASMAVPHDWAPAQIAVPRAGGEIALPDGQTAVAEPLPGGEAFVLWGAPHARGGSASGAGPNAPLQPAGLELELLTRRPSGRLRGEPVEFSLRHAELLTVLLLSPRGLTAEQLALELYGGRGKAVTVRAELSRLRRLLGGVLQARPYRLVGDVHADLQDLQRAVRGADPSVMLDQYHQPLLGASNVGLIVEVRDTLDATIRHRVMRSGDPDLLLRWCQSPSGQEDQPAAELLLSLLELGDPRRGIAQARVTRLRRMFGDAQA
jgi:hypothetical protein